MSKEQTKERWKVWKRPRPSQRSVDQAKIAALEQALAVEREKHDEEAYNDAIAAISTIQHQLTEQAEQIAKLKAALLIARADFGLVAGDGYLVGCAVSRVDAALADLGTNT